MADTSIEWTDVTWNPVRGCARVSSGCEHCYAERVAHRFSGKGGKYEGLTVLGKKGPRWSGEARFVPEKLGEPLTWRKGRRVFVNSMSDLFHEGVTFEQIAAVFGIMASCPQHTFQILTKRAARALAFYRWAAEQIEAWRCGGGFGGPVSCLLFYTGTHGGPVSHPAYPDAHAAPWPLTNVQLGVSCEDQQRADERIPLLLQCPAAVRFVSAEPLLGPIDFGAVNDGSWYDREGAQLYDALSGSAYWRDGDHGLGGGPRLDWVIVGGESGHGARECHVDWIRSIVEQCKAAEVPCFVKQLGANIRVSESEPLGDAKSGWSPFFRECVSDDFLIRLPNNKGGDEREWPHDLRGRRQFPEVRGV